MYILKFCRNKTAEKLNKNWNKTRKLSLMWVQNYMQNLNIILVSKFGDH